MALAFARPEHQRAPMNIVTPGAPLKLIWNNPDGPSGGGGGGGKDRVQPARRAAVVGRDLVDAPVNPPPAIRDARLISTEPRDAPVLAAVNMGASLQLHPGVIDERAQVTTDSQGPGSTAGAGSGERGGNGNDVGRGIGPGRDAGIDGGVFRVGNGVTAPRLIYSRPPVYTNDAMRARISGTVLLECIVEPDGTVRQLKILRSLDPVYGLDEQAIKAVRAWRFAPATRHGEPVAVVVTVETAFTIH